MINMDFRDRYYVFEGPGMLEQFINGVGRHSEGIFKAELLDAGANGLFFPHAELQPHIPPDALDKITDYVEDMTVSKGATLAEKYHARTVTCEQCLMARATVAPPQPAFPSANRAQEWGDALQAGTLMPVKTPYSEVLLMVTAGPADNPGCHLRRLIRNLAELDEVRFDYLLNADPEPDSPFKYLVRISRLQFFSYLQNWIMDSNYGVYAALCPWKVEGVYISVDYEWHASPEVIQHVMGNCGYSHVLVVVKESAEAGGIAMTDFKLNVRSEDWIPGCRSDMTRITVPVTGVPIAVDKGKVDLEFDLRLETDLSRDVYKFKARQLGSRIRQLQEEQNFVKSMLVRSEGQHLWASLYLYSTAPSEGSGRQNDLDPALKALLLDYPARCLRRLLHVRVDPKHAQLPAPVDFVVDYGVVNKEREGQLWAAVQEDKPLESPWLLPVTYYPAEGGVFDLDQEIYRHHRLAVFLPRGTALRPRLNYEDLPTEKIVDLLCTGSPTIAPEARKQPHSFVFIFLQTPSEGRKQAISLMTVSKGAFEPLGNRIEYFNTSLLGADEMLKNLPAPHADVKTSWAMEAVELLYRKDLVAAIDTAQSHVAMLKRNHETFCAEARGHEQACAKLKAEAKEAELSATLEVEHAKRLAAWLQDRRRSTFNQTMAQMRSFRDMVEGFVKEVPRDVAETHRRDLDNILREADETYRRIENKLAELDAAIAAVTSPPVPRKPAAREATQ